MSEFNERMNVGVRNNLAVIAIDGKEVAITLPTLLKLITRLTNCSKQIQNNYKTPVRMTSKAKHIFNKIQTTKSAKTINRLKKEIVLAQRRGNKNEITKLKKELTTMLSACIKTANVDLTKTKTINITE